MVGHGGSSAGSYLADRTSPIPSHCASIVVTSTELNLEEVLRVQTCLAEVDHYPILPSVSINQVCSCLTNALMNVGPLNSKFTICNYQTDCPIY